MNKFSYFIAAGLIAVFLSGPAALAGCGCEMKDLKAEQNEMSTKPQRGEVTLKSVGAGVTSLIIPGVGQFINDEPKGKVTTHAVAGFLLPGVIHLFSAYDAMFDREGGYWKGRI